VPLSYAQYAGNGSTTTFSVPFPYLLKAHVKLYTGFSILSGTYTSLLVDGTDYTWTSSTQVQLSAAPANGVTLTVLRDTPDSSQLVPWQDGSNLIAEDLNIADLQNLYVVQEQQDRNDAGITQSTTAINTANAASATAIAAAASIGGKLDKSGGTMTGAIAMGANKITGLGDPTSAQDAATKAFVDTQVGVVSASATSAASSASASAASAAAAASSQTAAAGSAANANASAGAAATSATTAASSQSAAATSASNAALSATNAATSATASAASATTSTNQATAAAGSATSAATAQAAAEAARDSALAAYDNFDDRYLGAKASNPVVDNDGNPLVAGALYFNTTSQDMRIYTGTAWVSAYANGTTFLQLTGGTMTGNITFAGGQPTATTSGPNIVQLTDSTASTSTTTAATPNSVKLAFDLATTANTTANAALPKAGGSISGNVDNTSTGYFDLPAGTTAQRPGSPNSGMIRFNSDLGQFEGYNGSAWSSVGGGATGGGSDTVFVETSNVVTQSYTLSSNKNAVTAGPVTINSGATVTVPSGQSWVII
jgi:hypothetical protein